MNREELLFHGQAFLEAEDWPLMNDYDVAALIGIHSKDFTFYFGSKNQYESEILEMYADQHLLNAKTQLSCCFRGPTKRLNKYLIYLTEENTSKPKLTERLFSPLTKGLDHPLAFIRFLTRLTNLLANCLKENFEAGRTAPVNLDVHARKILEFHLARLKKMNLQERYTFSQKIRKNNELLTYPEVNTLLQYSVI